jgi:hypothetical protein
MNKINTKIKNFIFWGEGRAQFDSLPHAQKTLLSALAVATADWKIKNSKMQCHMCAYWLQVFTIIRGERANGGHLREMQDKTKNIHEVETLYKLAFSLKGLALKYAV